MIEVLINGTPVSVPDHVEASTPLLDVLRNELGLLGPKRGCAEEQCYACAVLVDGRAQPSCQQPLGHVSDGQVITTVEASELDPVREFFVAEQAGQCGFCLAGMVVAAQGLLNRIRRPNDAQIREALDTNLCRCGVYDRVRRVIRFRIGEPEDPIWEVRPQPPLQQQAATPTPPPASPDGLSNQLEGGCVQAASWTLIEAVRLDDDGATPRDWETYPILRFSQSFPVRTVLLDRPDQPSLGAGEAAAGPMGAAIANAVADAVGVRLRDLPLTPDRVLAAFSTTDEPNRHESPLRDGVR